MSTREYHVIVECLECDYLKYFPMYDVERLEKCPRCGGNVEVY
jgi:uncharacterized paraquat-inducible protein A